jgi:hypothetical protein
MAVEVFRMRHWPIMLGVAVLVASFSVGTIATLASPFVVFPQASELVSPDRRFAVRSVDTVGAPSDFAGTFHALWLFELATGRSRKLCDYIGVASAAWTSNDFLVVTQYVSKRTSRALLFSAVTPQDPVILDKATLIRLVPPELRPSLRENDRVFVEGSRVEQETLHLTVWGYGQHDANGFRYRCQYALREGAIACIEERGSR